tara:strand:- start:350 stop:649 length:300 start_codon:yes stop_codon:yes gene_type:complete
MALPKFEIGNRPGGSEFVSSGSGSDGIDPELLRLLAKKRQKQGLLGPLTDAGQRPSQQQVGFKVKGAPIDPRLRAAMVLQRKLRQQQLQSQAPQSGRQA